MKLLLLLGIAGVLAAPISADKPITASGDEAALRVIWICGAAGSAMNAVDDPESRKLVIDAYEKLGCPAIQKAIGISDPREEQK